MKSNFAIILLSVLVSANSNCNHIEQTPNTKYKGRLEVSGICSNITISVIEGKIDTTKIVTQWTDETTDKNYSHAFKLGNPCNFPDTLKAGDEFYFTIDTAKQEDCAVCMAYYPTPSKSLNIKVLNQ